MTLNFYLRRHDNTEGQNEWLFLTAEQLRPNLDNRLISPQLPGNDSDTLHGKNSTNFILNLGTQQVTINTSGFLLDIASGDFPNLSNNPYASLPDNSDNNAHIPAIDDGDTDTTTVSNDQNGKEMRRLLYEYVADQAKTRFDRFVLGYPDWDENGHQEWEGMVNSLNSTEVAGEKDQYMYKFTFTVGET